MLSIDARALPTVLRMPETENASAGHIMTTTVAHPRIRAAMASKTSLRQRFSAPDDVWRTRELEFRVSEIQDGYLQ
jgi:hypothetical protein